MDDFNLGEYMDRATAWIERNRVSITLVTLGFLGALVLTLAF